MGADLELWKKAIEHLRGVLNPEMFSNWIEVITPSSIKNNCFILNVDNDIYQIFLEKNYRGDILNALKAAGAPADLTVKFEISAPNPDQQPSPPKAEPPPPEPQKKTRPKPGTAPKNSKILATPLNPTFTFENFVTGPSNILTHAMAIKVSLAPGQVHNPLFIYGPTGLGKTHLMQAVGHYILQTTEKTVCYVSCETFFNEYIETSYAKDRVAASAEFRKRYRQADVLLMDDIQFLGGKEGSQVAFFHMFDALFHQHKQIIITSDLPPKDLKDFEARLRSRFEWGVVAEIENTDFETRLAILRYKNSLAKNQLNDDALTFIAQNIKSNVRSLEGALARTVAFASLNNDFNITPDTLRTLLKDQLSEEHQKDLTCEKIQEAVVKYFDLHPKDMTSRDRTREVADPRMIAMFLCRKLTSLSLKTIAKAFKKTNAAIVHARKEIQARMEVDKKEDLLESIKKITIALGRDPSEIAP